MDGQIRSQDFLEELMLQKFGFCRGDVMEPCRSSNLDFSYSVGAHCAELGTTDSEVIWGNDLLSNMPEKKSAKSKENAAAGGLQSIDGAMVLLRVLASQMGPTPLRELARACSIPTSKAHRYLSSFVHAGLATTDGAGRYDLGKGAMEVGLAALARRDSVNAVGDALPEFVARTGLTALVSVWGTSGPTVVRWQRAAAPVITSLGLGTTFPLISSATGRAFLAYMPEVMTAQLLKRELSQIKRQSQLALGIFPEGGSSLSQQVRGLIAMIKEQGYSTVDGRFIPGLVAVSAPVLDWQGEAELVVTLIGADPALISPESQELKALLEMTKKFSISDGPK